MLSTSNPIKYESFIFKGYSFGLIKMNWKFYGSFIPSSYCLSPSSIVNHSMGNFQWKETSLLIRFMDSLCKVAKRFNSFRWCSNFCHLLNYVSRLNNENLSELAEKNYETVGKWKRKTIEDVKILTALFGIIFQENIPNKIAIQRIEIKATPSIWPESNITFANNFWERKTFRKLRSIEEFSECVL